MSRAALLTFMLAGLIIIGTSTSAYAAQLDATINPQTEQSPFKMKYQKTVFIEYPQGGKLFDLLKGEDWRLSGSADSSDPGVQDLIHKLNKKINSDGSHTQVSDLNVFYEFHLVGRNISTSIDFKVTVEGKLNDYVITKDQKKTLVDLGWRGLSVNDSIIVDGTNVNIPLNIIKQQEPEVYNLLQGTEAENVLQRPMINADFILKQPLSNWHFLFDPTGISVDASTFGLSEDIQGFVVSSWTMGESSIREGRQVERVFSAEINLDAPYIIRSVQSSDQGNLNIIGFGAIDKLDGVEIAGVTPKPPEGFGQTSTGDFPVLIIYGMAILAAVGGGAFFVISNRALKNEKQGQQGIDPHRLVGYQTSSSAGGYQTNRGEAQLRDESDYQKTRSYYDESSTDTKAETKTPPPTQDADEATCGCAGSKEMGSECDCELQGACFCDSTCQCTADVCKENVSQMK